MYHQYIVLPESLSFSKIFSVKPEPLTTLWFMLHEVPDPRRAQGRRHDLPLLLTLAILALCCGHLSYEAMEEWCQNYQQELKTQVPFLSGHMPDATTFHRVFARIDVKVLESVLGEWLQAVTPLRIGEGIALDGKSIHGAGIHLVSAFAHIAQTVLFEQGTDIKGKELVVVPEVIKKITIKDRIVTGDALFAQKTLCEVITDKEGGYVFRVKGNQDTLEKDIRLFFAEPPFGAAIETYTTVNRWKGRIEKRTMQISNGLVSYLSWPGLNQVWKLTKEIKQKGSRTVEQSVGIARIPKELSDTIPIAQKVSECVRGHWGIENRLHRTRDTVFNEDHGTIRKGSAPQTMAALRNLVTSIFHLGTVRSFPKAQRRFAAKPTELFTFLGLIEIQKQYIYA